MAMANSKGLWAWLKDNIKVLTLISTVITALVAGVWQVYQHFEKKAEEAKAASTAEKAQSNKPTSSEAAAKSDGQIVQKAEASNGGTAINAGRDVIINK